MKIEFSNARGYHLIGFETYVGDNDDDFLFREKLAKIKKMLKELFPSIEFVNETSVRFKIKDEAEEAHFLLWSNSEIEI